MLLSSALGLVLLSGCSTAFKAGQTPDDVYYSPGRDIASAKEEVKEKKAQDEYQEYVGSQDDRYLRMKIANRGRWNSLDNFDYWNDSRYDFGSCYGSSSVNTYNWTPGWNVSIGYGRRPYFGGFGWSDPIYTLVSYGKPKSYSGYTSGSNISAYKNRSFNNANYGYKDPKTGAFINSNSTSGFGNLLKRVFTGGQSDNSGSYDRPARTFSNPSNSNTTPATSSSAGGTSGGFSSTGTSTTTGRGGKG